MSTFGLVAFFGFLFFCAGYGFGRDRERWRWQERELYRVIGINPKSFGRGPYGPEPKA